MSTQPAGELHTGFSAEDAVPTPWADAEQRLADADIAWFSTVRPDGRPHVTPVIFVWLDGAAYVNTGPDERKAKNLAANAHCTLTTGCNDIASGVDVVVEGEAVRVADPTLLHHVADAFAAKYLPRDGASVFHASLRDGTSITEKETTALFQVRPTTAFGFGKGAFSQMRWRF